MEYVVYLTEYRGHKLPRWYIGSSSKEKVLNGYTGSVSSKKWSEIYYSELDKNRHLFKVNIISYHKTRSEAADEELRLQKLHSVVTNDDYFNESYATKGGYFYRDKSGHLNTMYGQGHKILGKRNGRHKTNFKGDLKKVGERISESLILSNKNKKGLNPAAKKYYVYYVYYEPLNLFMDIDKGYLYTFARAFNISYISLYGTLKTNKPLGVRSKSPGYQLFEGTYYG